MFRSLSLLAAAELTASARRLLRALPWLVAGAVFGLIALVLALQAAHAWLVLSMTSMEAWLVLAGAMAFVAAICAGVGLVIRSRRARTSPLVAWLPRGRCLRQPLSRSSP
jgi:hypothetical protein